MPFVEKNLLVETRTDNNRAAYLITSYLDKYSRSINIDLIKEAEKCTDESELDCYRLLFSNICGLDILDNEQDKLLYYNYMVRAICRTDVSLFANDLYYTNIKLPNIAIDNWQFTEEYYAPYEAFICGDLFLTSKLEEIPHIKFFSSAFGFPVLKQDGREWMAIKPNEIETMRLPLQQISGNVLTLGLGLGYFTYMASEKQNIESVTVVEKDHALISFFRNYILPQFSHKEKVTIIESDAFAFLSDHLKNEHYDFLFADIWHDALDGLDYYLQLKRLEPSAPNTKFLYWVEETLLSRLRWILFDKILDKCNSYNAALERLSDTNLKAIASTIITQ